MVFIVEFLDPVEEEDDLDDGASDGANDIDGAQASRFGLSSIVAATRQAVNNSVDFVKAIRLPLSKAAMLKIMLKRDTIVKYEEAYIDVAGSLHKPMKRQNMRGFLMKLLPRVIIKDAFVEEFAKSVTGQLDGNISWQDISDWIAAQTNGDDSEDEENAGATRTSKDTDRCCPDPQLH
eukprot:scaffold550914_cov39-Prasinocladus_malaysianus.AAC.1